jgi:serine/threonine protein phosphatase PrpC
MKEPEMQCKQCGADVRPGARFCNQCGALQTEQAPEARSPQPEQAPPAAPQEEPDLGPGAGDEAQRMKRPPRVPRMREDGTITGGPAPSGQTTAAVEAPAAPPAPAAEPAPPAEITESAPPEPPPEPPRDVAPAPSPAAGQEEAANLADGRSWPLAPGMIVGERYRVEALLQAAPTQADENIYRVTDLRGYERCWSCGAAHETPDGQEPERFCSRCGADMLARAYLLRERIQSADEGEDEGESASAAPIADAAKGVGGERAFHQGMRAYRVALEVDETPRFPMGARLEVAAASDIGRDRAAGHNEDSTGYIVIQTAHDSISEPLALCIVADGLGGHASGREASRIVVRTLIEHVLRQVALPLVGLLTDAPSTEEGMKHVLRDGIAAANAALAQANDELRQDMGSTVVAALIFEETAYIANVGDSRAYVLEGEALRRVTTDHSLVEQLIASGIIGAEDRYTHPQRNQIFRSLGGSTDAEVDIFTQRLRSGMRILLCSDGLWEMVHDDEIARTLRATADPQAACDALVRAANEHGGDDNISALLIEVGG